MATAELLETLQPFGAGNPIPLLRVRNVRVSSYGTIGQNSDHLKIWLETGSRTVSAVYWGAAGRSRELVAQRRIDLVGTLGIDYWQGQRRLHVEIKDFHMAT
jgi:single-stranded-DNA-specific exonuclease